MDVECNIYVAFNVTAIPTVYIWGVMKLFFSEREKLFFPAIHLLKRRFCSRRFYCISVLVDHCALLRLTPQTQPVKPRVWVVPQCHFLEVSVEVCLSACFVGCYHCSCLKTHSFLHLLSTGNPLLPTAGFFFLLRKQHNTNLIPIRGFEK